MLFIVADQTVASPIANVSVLWYNGINLGKEFSMFVQIKDYPNYSIDENGVCKSTHVSKLLKPRTAGKGYYCYQLRNEHGAKNVYIHRLVAMAFIPNPENLPQVDHIDGDKSNNHVSNLRWVTNRTNMFSAGYDQRNEHMIESVGIKVIAVNGDTKLEFNSKSDMLRHFGYANIQTRVKLGEEYHYGKMKGFTVYTL